MNLNREPFASSQNVIGDHKETQETQHIFMEF